MSTLTDPGAATGAERPRPPSLEVERVTVTFGGLAALSEVSVSVPEGLVLGVIGPNGAGKTTLLNVVCGAVPPTEGGVRVRGRSVTRLKPHAVAGLGVGRSFQMAEGFAGFTVADYVSLGFAAAAPERRGGRRGRRVRYRALVTDLLDEVGLADRAPERMGALSYGTRKVVDLCRAVAGDPHLMLLDEPTSGLSREERAEMAGHVARFADGGRRTLVVVDHDVAFVTGISTRLLALAAGRVVAEGAPADVMADPAVIDAYLGAAQ